MVFISKVNIAAVFNSLPLPRIIHIGEVTLSRSQCDEILHSKLLSLVVGELVSFPSGKSEQQSDVDDFFTRLLECRQLRNFALLRRGFSVSVDRLVHRSPVSLSLECLHLYTVGDCCFWTMVRFCKAVALHSRVRYLFIDGVNMKSNVICFGSLLLWNRPSALQRVAFPATSWKNLTLLFQRLSSQQKAESVLDRVQMFTKKSFDIRRLVAEVIRCPEVQGIYKQKRVNLYRTTHVEDSKVNSFWIRVSELKTNLR